MTDAARKSLQDEILAEVQRQGKAWQEEDKRHSIEQEFIRSNVLHLSEKYWQEVAGIQIGQILTVTRFPGLLDAAEEVEVTGFTWYRNRESISFTLKVHPLTKDHKKARNRNEISVTLRQIVHGLGR